MRDCPSECGTVDTYEIVQFPMTNKVFFSTFLVTHKPRFKTLLSIITVLYRLSLSQFNSIKRMLTIISILVVDLQHQCCALLQTRKQNRIYSAELSKQNVSPGLQYIEITTALVDLNQPISTQF